MDPKYRLAELSDDALLVNLKRCVGGENEMTALMLAHLAEADARGAYRQGACASLVSYCVYELRLSEDEAQRRCRAARTARQFPILFEMLADASIHLTGILLLGRHLTQENHTELLARARYRTKREIEKLVAQVAPRSDVPSVIEPLGPASDGLRCPAPSTYSSMVHGVARYVRHLTPGNQPTQAPRAPSGWLEAAMAAEGAESLAAEFVSEPHVGAPEVDVAMAPADSDVAFASTRLDPEVASAPARPSSMRYRVQFTTDQTYVDLLEQARDLLEHQIPDRDLPTVQRLAIEALVEKLNRRKYGAFDTAERQAPRRADSERTDNERSDMAETSASPETASPETASPETASPETASPETAPSELAPATASAIRSASRSPSRHLPAALRRSVAKRDGGRCTYVDSRGVRCRETARLEFHHEHAHARGGLTCAENIRLRCRAHNDLAAQKDFGRHFIERKKRGEPPVTRAAPARNGDGSDP